MIMQIEILKTTSKSIELVIAFVLIRFGDYVKNFKNCFDAGIFEFIFSLLFY